MTTRMKLLALVSVCSMYGVFAACGGGGGGEDSSGNRVQGQAECFQQQTMCNDGTQAIKAAVESKECPYYCGNVKVSASTETKTDTATATKTETVVK